MSDLIKDIVTKYSEAKFDKAKLTAIISTYHDFIMKNDNHVSFFGGVLIGVYPIRFMDEDREHLVDTICEIVDYDSMSEELWDLPEIERKRHVSGNPLNYLYPWLMYQVKNCSVDNKIKERALEGVLNLFQIKFMTGIDKHFFKYRANEAVAQAMYEGLSNKSLIKKLGSWRAVIEYRSQYFMGRKSKYLEVINFQKDNTRVVELVNDMQGRAKKSYINLASAFHDAKDAEAKIMSQGSYQTIDGEKTLREFESNISKYVSGIKDILEDNNDFIKDELIEETIRIIETSSETNLRSTLLFISDNIGGSKKLDMTPEIEAMVLYIFSFIRKSGLRASDIPAVIGKLKNIFRSHKSSHDAVVNVKEKMGYVVSKAIKARHENTRSATKVAALLYLSLRILSIPYYNS